MVMLMRIKREFFVIEVCLTDAQIGRDVEGVSVDTTPPLLRYRFVCKGAVHTYPCVPPRVNKKALASEKTITEASHSIIKSTSIWIRIPTIDMQSPPRDLRIVEV